MNQWYNDWVSNKQNAIVKHHSVVLAVTPLSNDRTTSYHSHRYIVSTTRLFIAPMKPGLAVCSKSAVKMSVLR